MCIRDRLYIPDNTCTCISKGFCKVVESKHSFTVKARQPYYSCQRWPSIVGSVAQVSHMIAVTTETDGLNMWLSQIKGHQHRSVLACTYWHTTDWAGWYVEAPTCSCQLVNQWLNYLQPNWGLWNCMHKVNHAAIAINGMCMRVIEYTCDYIDNKGDHQCNIFCKGECLLWVVYLNFNQKVYAQYYAQQLFLLILCTI